MNILVICHYGLYKDFSFSFVHNQIREYAALGHRVRVIIPNGWGKPGRDGKRIGKSLLISRVDGVELYDLRYLTLSAYGENGFNTRRAIGAVRAPSKRIFSDFRPDVIHAHTLGFDSDIGAWLKKKWGCPLVVTTHGSDTAAPLQKGQADMLCAACNKADRIVAVSSALKEKLCTCGTVASLDTIVNGFVPRQVPENNQRHPLRMIQVCNLIPLKRVDVTVRAVAALQKLHPGMELVIIGQGPCRPELEELCQTLGIADFVRFLGQIPNEDVFRELCRSAFFVMASKPEGFGIVYLEAMAAGCVTIGTEKQGIADVIRTGENGFLVPADDPDAIVRVIENCIANPEKAASVAAAGQATANDLTWQTNAAQYLRLFAELSGTK